MDAPICVLAFLLAFLGGIATIYLSVTTTRNSFLVGCYVFTGVAGCWVSNIIWQYLIGLLVGFILLLAAFRSHIRAELDKETKKKKKEKTRVPPESNWKQYYMGPVRLRTGDHRINTNMGSPRLVFTVCLDGHFHHPDQQERVREQHRALVAARS